MYHEDVWEYIRATHKSVRDGVYINGYAIPNSFFPVFEVPTEQFTNRRAEIKWDLDWFYDSEYKPNMEGD